MGDNALTSENVPSIDNLRAHSPQIPDHSRGQPDTSGRVPAPLVAMGARICQVTPLRNDENYVCARAGQPPRARVRSADRDSLS